MKSLIYFQASMVQPLKFGDGEVISFTFYLACDYFFIHGLKLKHASKRGPMLPLASIDFSTVDKVDSM